MAQNLTPTAARMKAIRDKRAAMTDDRRKKKADNQRKRRRLKKDGVNLTNKDVHHCPDGSTKLVSTKDNRGNFGKGTKKENKTT
tara:strand:- start:517 stop:768 length:252 start_codon:yes stop_codon:yes gene_type:complete